MQCLIRPQTNAISNPDKDKNYELHILDTLDHIQYHLCSLDNTIMMTQTKQQTLAVSFNKSNALLAELQELTIKFQGTQTQQAITYS